MNTQQFQEVASKQWYAAATQALDFLLARAEREDAAGDAEPEVPTNGLENVSVRWNPVSRIFTLELSFKDASMSFIPLREGMTPDKVAEALDDSAACIGG